MVLLAWLFSVYYVYHGCWCVLTASFFLVNLVSSRLPRPGSPELLERHIDASDVRDPIKWKERCLKEYLRYVSHWIVSASEELTVTAAFTHLTVSNKALFRRSLLCDVGIVIACQFVGKS
jgi:hypothetical protein